MNSPDTSPVGFSTIITGMAVTLINTGVVFLTAIGAIQWDTPTQTAFNAFAVAVVNVLVFAGSYLWERGKVTPLARPEDEDGHELVRKGSESPTMAQTRSMLKDSGGQ